MSSETMPVSCPECGSSRQVPHQYQVRLLDVWTWQDAQRCESCGLIWMVLKQASEADRRASAALADMPPTPESFRYLRRMMGLTQAQLAEKMGVAGSPVVCRWESGKRVNPMAWKLLITLFREWMAETEVA